MHKDRHLQPHKVTDTKPHKGGHFFSVFNLTNKAFVVKRFTRGKLANTQGHGHLLATEIWTLLPDINFTQKI